MYYYVAAAVLAVLGVLNIVFALIEPPEALRPLVDGTGGRKMRALMRFVPEAHRPRVTRLVLGALYLSACTYAFTAAGNL